MRDAKASPVGSTHGTRASRIRKLHLAAAAALALVIAVVAFVPLAGANGVVGYFPNVVGRGAGQFSAEQNPDDAAVNATGAGSGAAAGDVYFADNNNVTGFANDPQFGRIEQFDQYGNYKREWGWDIVADGPGDTGADEEQSVTVPGSVTGGTFRLRVVVGMGRGVRGQVLSKLLEFEQDAGLFRVGDEIVSDNASAIPAGTTITDIDPTGTQLQLSSDIGFLNKTGLADVEYDVETTAPIPFNADAATVKEALEALDATGPGNVTVTGTPGNLNIAFSGGLLAHDDVLPMRTISDGLIGGVATASTVTNGGGPEVCNSGRSCKFVADPQPPGPSTGSAGSLSGASLAIEPSTGNVLAFSKSRVNVYRSDGTFQGAFGWGVKPGDTAPFPLDFCTIATGCERGKKGASGSDIGGGVIDSTTGHLFTTTGGSGSDLGSFANLNEYALSHDGSGAITGASFVRSFADDTVASGPDDAGANEVQTVDVPASVSGGTFTLKLPVGSQYGGGGAVSGNAGDNFLFIDPTGFVGVFQPGDFISSGNSAIPAGTTITSFDEGTGKVTLSANLASGFAGTGAGVTSYEVTAPINYNANANTGTGADNLQGRLEALPIIGSGNVTVSGGPGATNPFTVTFDGGTLAHDNVVQLIPNSTNLVGDTASVSTATEGGGYEFCDPSVDICKAGAAGSAIGQLQSGRQIAIDSQGVIYVLDGGGVSTRVQRFMPTPTPGSPPYTSYTPTVIDATSRSQTNTYDGTYFCCGHQPSGSLFGGLNRIAVDGTGGFGGGSTYVIDPSTHAVYKFDSAGNGPGLGGSNSLTGANVTPATTFSFGGDPDLAVDNSTTASSGYLYVLSEDAEKVYVFDYTGVFLHTITPGGGADICGVAVDSGGNAWISDHNNNSVIEYNAAGTATGTTISTAGHAAPCHLAFDSNDNLYVAGRPSSLDKYNSAGVFQSTIDPGYSSAVAVDPLTDHVFAVHSDRVSEYTAAGAFVADVGLGDLSSPIGVAFSPRTGKLSVSDSGDKRVHVFSADLSGDSLGDIAIGQGDDLLVNEQFNEDASTCSGGSPSIREHRILEFSPADVLQGVHGTCGRLYYGNSLAANPLTGLAYMGGPKVLAFDSQGFIDQEFTGVFVIGPSDPATSAIDSVTPNTVGATVTGTVNAHGPDPQLVNATDTTYQLQYKRSADSTWSSFGSPIPTGGGFADKDVTIHLGGLEAKTSYDIRLVAHKEGFPDVITAPQTFQTLPIAPTIEAFSSTGVTAKSADLHALIHPQGSETTYHFEYGPTTGYGHSTPETSIGDGYSAQAVVDHIDGLDPVVYHFRVVAHNDSGTTTSKDQTFTFFPPPCPNETLRQQNGSAYLPDCRSYELVSPSDAGDVSLEDANYLSAPYATTPARFGFAGAFGAIPGTEPAEATSKDSYVATRTSTGWETTYVGMKGSQTLSSAFSGTDLGLNEFLFRRRTSDPQPAENIPHVIDVSGTELGRWPANFADVPGANTTHGILLPSRDFSHLAFSSNNVDFDPNGHGVTSAPGSAYDYDTAAGTTTLISKTAAGADILQEPTNHSPDEVIEFPPVTSSGVFSGVSRTHPSVSIDGSHILMSTASFVLADASVVPQHRLYMSVNDAVHYDVSKGYDVNYVGMTDDGKKVFYTTDQDLTDDNSDNDTSTDLYMWYEDGNGPGVPSVTVISKGSGGSGNGDDCHAGWTEKCGVGTLPGSGGGMSDYPVATQSGDVYFTSPELLDGPSDGIENGQNLYVSRNGTVHFVATLAADGSEPVERIDVSPDGLHAAFATKSRLTSYDNAGFSELYSFDVSSGEVVCVSCLPSGDPPTADVTLTAESYSNDGGLPRLLATGGPFMSNDGRTFFLSADPLVPQDTSASPDIYEYVDGRPQLITSGTGIDNTSVSSTRGAATQVLEGVSADGVNVYFGTFDTLVSQDHNGAYFKFYDARTGGGFPPEVQNQPCLAADECHGPGSSAPAASGIASKANLGAGGNAAQTRAHKSKHHKKKKRHHKHRRARRRHGAHRANANPGRSRR